MTLNRRQGAVIFAGVALVGLTLLFIPWKESREQFKLPNQPAPPAIETMEYRLILASRPEDMPFIDLDEKGTLIAGKITYRVHWLILFAKWLVIAILVGFGIWWFADGPPKTVPDQGFLE